VGPFIIFVPDLLHDFVPETIKSFSEGGWIKAIIPPGGMDARGQNIFNYEGNKNIQS